MAITEQEIIADLPALLGFYTKVKDAISNPSGLSVTPAVISGDKTDEGLAIGQALVPDLIALVRTILVQNKS